MGDSNVKATKDHGIKFQSELIVYFSRIVQFYHVLQMQNISICASCGSWQQCKQQHSLILITFGFANNSTPLYQLAFS